MLVAAVGVALATAACTSGHDAKKNVPNPAGARTTAPGPVASKANEFAAADSALILTMYDTINRAFQRTADDGVRAIIAAQDRQDRGDVDFARCVSAILPGATTLPPSKKFHFTPNIATMQPDPGYSLTSNRVKGLHPQGRIYVTDVTITDGGTPRVSPRHQVILNGKAYQFSAC